MKTINRVEIITSSPQSEKVVRLLEEQDVPGYTLIPKILGKGSRGVQDGAGLHDAFDNCMFLVACTDDQLERITEPLKTFLQRHGGVLMVSDARWFEH